LVEIQAVFGDAVLLSDGTLDRAAMRRRVFADAAARRQLEAILHPRIRQQVEQALSTLTAPYAVVVIPLLLETGGYQDLLDRVLVVDCPEALQIERVMGRNGLARDEVERIMAAQVGRAERLAAADDVIANTGLPEALCARVTQLHQAYLTRAAASAP
jgi:dephospho-CoA kinase